MVKPIRKTRKNKMRGGGGCLSVCEPIDLKKPFFTKNSRVHIDESSDKYTPVNFEEAALETSNDDTNERKMAKAMAEELTGNIISVTRLKHVSNKQKNGTPRQENIQEDSDGAVASTSSISSNENSSHSSKRSSKGSRKSSSESSRKRSSESSRKSDKPSVEKLVSSATTLKKLPKGPRALTYDADFSEKYERFEKVIESKRTDISDALKQFKRPLNDRLSADIFDGIIPVLRDNSALLDKRFTEKGKSLGTQTAQKFAVINFICKNQIKHIDKLFGYITKPDKDEQTRYNNIITIIKQIEFVTGIEVTTKGIAPKVTIQKLFEILQFKEQSDYKETVSNVIKGLLKSLQTELKLVSKFITVHVPIR